MKVKRYLANDIQEAMIKIRHELGREAVILHSRKVRKPGFMSWFSKPMVEVVAAVDEPLSKGSPAKAEAKATEAPVPPSPAVQNAPESPVEQPKANPEIETLKEQMASIQTILGGILTNEQSRRESVIVTDAVPEIPDKESVYYDLLRESDLTHENTVKLMDLVSRQIRITPDNDKAVRNALRITVKDQLGQPYTIGGETASQKVCFFVGPTGVGKTTTLAKLAARLSLIDNRSVGLITADTFRIAAVEQLKTYSEILGIPLSVIYEPDEIKDAIGKFKDKDYILVDTAGRSHKNEEMQADLANLIGRVENSEIFLVISLNTGYKDIISILESYRFLGEYKLLFTKLDEANSLGNILNVKMTSGKPLSYFTIGQSVPDDIEVADAEKVARKLLGEHL